MYKTIIVPVDGSKGAHDALKKAIVVAKEYQASLMIFNVVDNVAIVNTSYMENTTVNGAMSEAHELVHQYVQEARDAGVATVTGEVHNGNPKTIIARDVPNQTEADLIVMGATGLNKVEQLLIGSVTEFVTKQAPCDILVVK